MNLFLAESGGVWKAYFREGKKTDLYLAGTGSPIKKYVGGENDINIYLAGDSRFKQAAKEKANESVLCQARSRAVGGKMFQGTNILQSFYYCDKFTEEAIIPNCKRFLLDSGAFTFFNSGKQVDWNEYAKQYAAFIVKNKVDLYFELDIDTIIGYDAVKNIRNRIEDATGKPSIPVWHRSRGIDEYYRMCEKYDYVAIGGIVSGEIKRTEYKFFTQLIDIAHKHGAKVHGLGFTNLKGLTKYHFDSVDSTSWISGNRFGHIYQFNGKTMIKYNKKEGQRLANSRAVALHNFSEWVKFQRYAETNL